jgi:hypothetical protein
VSGQYDWTRGEVKAGARRIAGILGPSLGRAAAEMMGISELLGQSGVVQQVFNIVMTRGLRVPITLHRGGGPADFHHYEGYITIDWDAISPINFGTPSLGFDTEHIGKLRDRIEGRFGRNPITPVTLLVFVCKRPAYMLPTTIVQGLSLRPWRSLAGHDVPRNLNSMPYCVDRDSTLSKAREVWQKKVALMQNKTS